MKRLSFFLLGIFVIGLITTGIWFSFFAKPIVTQKPIKTIPTTITESATPTSQPEAPSEIVTPLASEVSISPFDDHDKTFHLITPSTDVLYRTVMQGHHVKTNATGRALLEGVNTTVLDSNSEVTIEALDTQKNQSRFFLEAGHIWSRVKKLSDKGEFYEIETQHARASVRGTSFGLKREGKKLILYVMEGVVNFGPIPPKDDTSIQYSDANVRAGQKAVLYEDDYLPTVSDITDVDKRDSWFVFNNPIAGTPTSLNTSVPLNNTQTNTSTSNTTETIAPPSSNNASTTEMISPPPSDTSTPSESIPAPQPNRTITPATSDSAELLLSSLSPNIMVAGTAVTFTLSGSGFVKAGVSSVFIGNMNVTSFKVWNDTTIKVSVDAGQFGTAGDYDVTVVGDANASSTLSPGLTVTRAPLR